MRAAARLATRSRPRHVNVYSRCAAVTSAVLPPATRALSPAIQGRSGGGRQLGLADPSRSRVRALQHPRLLPRVTLALLLALACGCVRPALPAGGGVLPQPSAPVLLAVVTWNVHVGAGDLRGLIEAVRSGTLTAGIPADALFLLQEAVDDGDQAVSAVAAGAGMTAAFSPVREVNGRLRGNAILSTMAIGAPRTIALPQERQPRGAVMAEVQLGGRPLFVASVHLENRVSWLRGGLLSDGARGRQAAALVAALPAGHGIVGGDLNTWLGANEPAWKRLAARFPVIPGIRLRPTFRDRLVLDHLFFDLPADWTVTRTVLADTYRSDHHPVLAVISLPPGVAPRGADSPTRRGNPAIDRRAGAA